jgi:hypothetical protein
MAIVIRESGLAPRHTAGYRTLDGTQKSEAELHGYAQVVRAGSVARASPPDRGSVSDRRSAFQAGRHRRL